MGLRVNINTYRPQPDGKCPIRLYLTRNGKQAYYPVKSGADQVYCDPKHFDGSRVKKSHPNANIINGRIAESYNRFEQLMLSNPAASVGELISLYEGKSSSNTTLFGFIDNFINECKEGKIKRDNKTIIRYGTSINHLKAFNPKLDFGNINKQFYDEFTNHCRNLKDKKGKTYRLHENTIGGIIKHLKVFLNEANERGVTNTQEHKKKYFKTIEIDTDAIYLDEKEIDKIINFDTKDHPHLQAEKDRFIVSYYLLFRWSDSIKIEKSMIFKEKGIEYIQKRWEKAPYNEVRIPIKPIVKKILVKNNYTFKKDTAQEANWKIKEICRLAKINQKVHLNGLTGPKHEFVSSHVCRRSAATNLYLSGVSPKFIMDLGGWKSVQVFMKYIRVTKIETARAMANHPFYK